MSTERSIHEPDKQGFISSIHNYCDRRCEKCRFIRQCRVGIMEADDVDDDREPGDERVEDYEARLRKVMGVPEDDDDGTNRVSRHRHSLISLEPNQHLTTDLPLLCRP